MKGLPYKKLGIIMTSNTWNYQNRETKQEFEATTKTMKPKSLSGSKVTRPVLLYFRFDHYNKAKRQSIEAIILIFSNKLSKAQKLKFV